MAFQCFRQNSHPAAIENLPCDVSSKLHSAFKAYNEIYRIGTMHKEPVPWNDLKDAETALLLRRREA